MSFDPGDDKFDPDRLCICECQSGRFVTSMTRAEVEYIFNLVIKSNANSGEFISSVVAEGAMEKVTDMKDHFEREREE